MWPSQTNRMKSGTKDTRSLVKKSFAPAIVPQPLYSAICVSTIVGGVLMCPGAAQAQVPSDDVTSYANANVGGPVVAILSPSYSDVLHGRVSVLIGVQARKYTPKTVEMFVDGKSATGGPIPLDSAPSTGFEWDTTIFTDGTHRLTVRVVDTQGFIGQSEVQVYINNGRKRETKAPTLSWINVKDGDVLKGQTHITLNAANDFGVKYVFVSINPAATPKRKPALRQYFLNRPPYDVLFDTTAVPDGMYVLDALAWDALENEGKAPQRIVGVLNNGINPTWASTLESLRSTPESASTAAPRVAAGSGTASSVSGEAGSAPRVAASGLGNSKTTSSPAAAGGSAASRQRPSGSGSSKAPTVAMATEAGTRRTAPERAYVAPSDGALTPDFNERNGVVSGRARSSKVASSRRAPALNGSAPSLAMRGGGTEPTEKAAVYAGPLTDSTGDALSTIGNSSMESAISGRPNAALTARRDVPGLLTAPELGERGANGSTRLAARETPGSARMNSVSPSAEAGLTVDSVRDVSGPVTGLIDHVIPSRISSAGQPSWSHSNSLRMSRLEVAPREAATEAQTAAVPAVLGTHPDFTVVDVSSLPGARISGPSSKPAASNRTTRPSRTTAFAALPPSMPRPRQGARRPAIVVSRAHDANGALPTSYVTERDETLAAIATRFNLKPATLAAVNKMRVGAVLSKGTKVELPKTLLISYDGKTVQSDVPAIMVGSTSAAAFRHLFEAQGGKVNWDAANRRVTARNGSQQVTLTIGSKTAIVNEQKVMMDLAAFLLSGRTMVPVRLFEKTMQAKVEFEPSTNRLLVSIENPAHTM